MIQISTEGARFDDLSQVFVGGCDYADVELYGMITADTFELTLLQNPQQLCLHVAGKFAYLVQK